MNAASIASMLRRRARAARRDAEEMDRVAAEIETVDKSTASVSDLDAARAKRVKEKLRRMGERT